MKRLFALILASVTANTNPAVKTATDVPWQFNVSEVSKDGHVVHNRLSFNCVPGVSSVPKQIDCVIVQQNLQEPTPPSRGDQDKAISEMGDVLKVCSENFGQAKGGEPRHETEFRAKIQNACKAKDRAAAIDAIRAVAEVESQTCKLFSVVLRKTFTEVDKDTWISKEDPGICDNIKVTSTLRRNRDFWNYSEVEVATPSKNSLCHGISGTTHFTWDKAVTAYDLKCRYVEM